MSAKDMPDQIWVTGEHSLWPTFRSFSASDLDHTNDDGTSDYPAYTRTDLSQAAVAAALEAAAAVLQSEVDDGNKLNPEYLEATVSMKVVQGMLRGYIETIRALITPAQHDALAAHVAAEVAKARAEDAAGLQSFDSADWFWRTMDPDDNADNPAEVIHRAYFGQFTICEIASSYRGPTRFGFNAPVLDPESDDEEFLHFETQKDAMEAAKSRQDALAQIGANQRTALQAAIDAAVAEARADDAARIAQLEQDLADANSGADDAYRRGYWAGGNGA